jgi:hypothetical protein
MEDIREKIIEIFEEFFNSIKDEYNISDESKKVMKEKIEEDIIDIND